MLLDKSSSKHYLEEIPIDYNCKNRFSSSFCICSCIVHEGHYQLFDSCLYVVLFTFCIENKFPNISLNTKSIGGTLKYVSVFYIFDSAVSVGVVCEQLFQLHQADHI